MTPEEAYEEALRRIREAERTGAVELDLRELPLNRLPRELGRLPSLQSLDLTKVQAAQRPVREEEENPTRKTHFFSIILNKNLAGFDSIADIRNDSGTAKGV